MTIAERIAHACNCPDPLKEIREAYPWAVGAPTAEIISQLAGRIVMTDVREDKLDLETIARRIV